MEGSVSPVQPGGVPPLSTHSASQESEALSPKTHAVAIQLLQQTLKQVHGMAEHNATQLARSPETGSKHVWAG